MPHELTITLEEEVFQGLQTVVGHDNISQFINGLVRPHVVKLDLEAAYREMAADEAREAQASKERANAKEAARLAAIDESYGMFAGRGRSVDEFLAERHAEGEADYFEGKARSLRT